MFNSPENLVVNPSPLRFTFHTAVITSIFIILEGIVLLLGSIACLVVNFKVLSAKLVFCYYALIIFIVLPFASFLVYAGSIAIYGVRKVRVEDEFSSVLGWLLYI